VSALGHYLEEEGVATVAISLVRPQTEKTRPPRALWVPFELGRPFGPPSDPPFQRRVIGAALQLLERERGPVILEDFPDDDPRERADPAWRPPFPAANLAGLTPAALADALEAEIAFLRDAYGAARARRGRSCVGLTGLPPAEFGRYVGRWLAGDAPQSPRDGFSAVLMLRFAVDDLKAYHLETAASGFRPSSRQLGDWLWRETAAGAAIIALRAMGLAGNDERLKLVAGNFLVPAIRVPAPR
jgi:hypothetical protein